MAVLSEVEGTERSHHAASSRRLAFRLAPAAAFAAIHARAKVVN